MIKLSCSVALLSTLMMAAACGGKTDDNNASGGSAGQGASGGSGGGGAIGGGGSGGGGAVAGGGSGGMPNECAVDTTEPGPYPTTIRFVNPTGVPVWIREDCQLNWDLYSCADGYQSELPHAADCTAPCSDSGMGCIACGACMMQGLEVTNAAPVETKFSGYTYTFAQKNGCQCYNKAVAMPGKYAIRVPVFASKDDAESFTAGMDVWAYFELPAKTGVVDVVLTPVGTK